MDGKLADIETRLAEIVNQKTLALGDYAVSVNEEIDRNHKELFSCMICFRQAEEIIRREYD